MNLENMMKATGKSEKQILRNFKVSKKDNTEDSFIYELEKKSKLLNVDAEKITDITDVDFFWLIRHKDSHRIKYIAKIFNNKPIRPKALKRALESNLVHGFLNSYVAVKDEFNIDLPKKKIISFIEDYIDTREGYGKAVNLMTVSGLEPSEEHLQKLKSKILQEYIKKKNYNSLDQFQHLEYITPFKKSGKLGLTSSDSKIIQKTYVELTKNSNMIEHLGFLENFSGEGPFEETIHKMFSYLIKTGKVDEILELEKIKGVKPVYSKENVPEVYDELIESAQFSKVLRLKEISSIDSKLSSSQTNWMFNVAIQHRMSDTDGERWKKWRAGFNVEPPQDIIKLHVVKAYIENNRGLLDYLSLVTGKNQELSNLEVQKLYSTKMNRGSLQELINIEKFSEIEMNDSNYKLFAEKFEGGKK